LSSAASAKPHIAKLDRSHNADAFDCGAAALNVYLQRYALANQSKRSPDGAQRNPGFQFAARDPHSASLHAGYGLVLRRALLASSEMKSRRRHAAFGGFADPTALASNARYGQVRNDRKLLSHRA
jgi:hypothetical protein